MKLIKRKNLKKILLYSIPTLLIVYVLFGLIMLNFITPKSVFQNEKSHNDKYVVEPERNFVSNKANEKLEMLTFTSKVKDIAILYFGGAPGRSPRDLNTATQVGTVFSIAAPGYGQSQGTPDNKNIYETVDLGMDFIHSKGYEDKNIIVVGHSFGGTQAVYASTKYPNLRKSVIVNSFYSIEEMCEKDKPIFVCIFLTDYINTSNLAKDTKSKIIQFHNPNDGYVPFKQGQKLFEKLGSSNKTFYTIDGTHGDFDVIHALTKE